MKGNGGNGDSLERVLTEALQAGIVVAQRPPHYFNAVVGKGKLGYLLPTFVEKRQYNLVLTLANNEEIFKSQPLKMSIHSIFFDSSEKDHENVESFLVGKTVVLKADENQRPDIINSFYCITGTITLECEPP